MAEGLAAKRGVPGVTGDVESEGAGTGAAGRGAPGVAAGVGGGGATVVAAGAGEMVLASGSGSSGVITGFGATLVPGNGLAAMLADRN
jgi:hypothetical protein